MPNALPLCLSGCPEKTFQAKRREFLSLAIESICELRGCPPVAMAAGLLQQGPVSHGAPPGYPPLAPPLGRPRTLLHPSFRSFVVHMPIAICSYICAVSGDSSGSYTYIRMYVYLFCLGRYTVVTRRCLASYTPRLAELQVEGGNVGPNVGSAATPPSRLLTPFGRRRAAALRRWFQ